MEPAPQADAPLDPLDAFLKEEHAPVPDVETGLFDDPLAEILKSGAMDAGEPAIEDPLEALLISGSQFDAGNSEKKDDSSLFKSIDDANKEPLQFQPPAPPVPDKNVIPNLPDDVKPNQGDNNSQDDFLRMFPGAKG